MKRKSTGKTIVVAPNRSLVCHTCGLAIAGFESVHCGSLEAGYRDLCNRCFNEEVAEAGGIEFSHVAFEPFDLADAAGNPHRFYFALRLFGAQLSLEAFELVQGEPGGYEFQVIGDAEADPFALMGQMVARIRRLLARQHLTSDPHMPGLHIAEGTVRGRIHRDRNEDGRVPLLMIDGKEISWDQFGRMLMSFEGWPFKLEIRDPSDEV